jgi:hypothetical protein
MDIILLKKRLNELGFGPLSVEGPEAKIFGPKTTEAVKNFQIGHFLEVDGKVGPETLKALFPAAFSAPDKYHVQPWKSDANVLRLRAVDILSAQVGVRERYPNGGPAVETFLSAVGLGPGYSWCMAFQFWGVDQAARELGVHNPMLRTGGVLRQWNEGHCIHITDVDKVIPGDIFIMKVGNSGAGHTGMVRQIRVGGIMDTVEGNTNDDGSANGDGVYFRQRNFSRMEGVIRV